MRYEYIKEEDRWEYRGKPDEDIKTPDKELIAAVVAKVKADRKAVDRENKTLVVTKKEDLVLNVLSNEKFDFQCYIPACEFVTNDKKLYERHVVTCHYDLYDSEGRQGDEQSK